MKIEESNVKHNKLIRNAVDKGEIVVPKHERKAWPERCEGFEIMNGLMEV